MCGSRTYFNSHNSNSRDIAVRIKDDLGVDDVVFKNIITGNLSHLNFKLMDERYLINFIYAPNEDLSNDDTKMFFKVCFDNSYFHKYNHVLYAGNFNVALNHKLDTSGYFHIKNQQSRQYIKSRMATNELIAIRWEKNNGTKAFTFDRPPIEQRQGSTTTWFLKIQKYT